MVRNSDLRGVWLAPIPHGDKVWGTQPTLDFCGSDFRSETARVARLQEMAVGADGRLLQISDRGWFSNESVVYDSADSAAQAFDEIR
jgi:hypothetical protein